MRLSKPSAPNYIESRACPIPTLRLRENLREAGRNARREWLGDFASGFRVEAMVADDLNTRKPVAERQIRIARVKKRARKRIDKITRWEWVKLNGLGLTRRAWSGRDGPDMSEPVAPRRRALRNPPQNAQPFLGQLRRLGHVDN